MTTMLFTAGASAAAANLPRADSAAVVTIPMP